MLNQTPHDINVIKADGTTVTFPKSDDLKPARIEAVATVVGEVDGIEVIANTYGDTMGIVGMVDIKTAKANGGVLVSSIVLGQLGAEWKNIAFAPDTSPAGIVRDEKGTILGVKRLVTVA